MGKEFVIACSQCGKRLKVTERFLGRQARCPGCGSMIKISERPQEVGGEGAEPAVVPLAEEGRPRRGSMLIVTKQGDVGVVTFTTSRILDQSNVQQLGEEFDALLEKQRFNKIVMNFESITYMSSTVLGKLVSLYKKVKAAHGHISLCNIGESIYEIFKIMRFDKLFDIYDSEDKAVIAMMKVR